jgi:hypothetical protein
MKTQSTASGVTTNTSSLGMPGLKGLRYLDRAAPNGSQPEDLAIIAKINPNTSQGVEVTPMCRNIKTLFNFDPPVTEEEVRAASLQFVRKISGFTKPSKANEAAFLAAVDEVAGVATRLLRSLETTAPPKNREEEAAKAKARAAERFGAA